MIIQLALSKRNGNFIECSVDNSKNSQHNELTILFDMKSLSILFDSLDYSRKGEIIKT